MAKGTPLGHLRLFQSSEFPYQFSHYVDLVDEDIEVLHALLDD